MASDHPKPTDPAFAKLESVFGREKARELVAEICRERAIDSLDHPQQRLVFGEALVARGGLLEMIGRAIKVQALLHGARPLQ
jgi:hypothetical protein